jgi:hypothetical protein
MARLILLGGHLPFVHRWHVVGLGLGFSGANEAPALALFIFALIFLSFLLAHRFPCRYSG